MQAGWGTQGKDPPRASPESGLLHQPTEPALEVSQRVSDLFTLSGIEIPISQPNGLSVRKERIMVPRMRPEGAGFMVCGTEFQNDFRGDAHEPYGSRVSNCEGQWVLQRTSLYPGGMLPALCYGNFKRQNPGFGVVGGYVSNLHRVTDGSAPDDERFTASARGSQVSTPWTAIATTIHGILRQVLGVFHNRPAHFR